MDIFWNKTMAQISALRPTQTRKRYRNTVVETLFPWCTNRKTLVEETKCSGKSHEQFLFLRSKKCFRKNCFLSTQMGKHLGKQLCFVVWEGLHTKGKTGCTMYNLKDILELNMLKATKHIFIIILEMFDGIEEYNTLSFSLLI